MSASDIWAGIIGGGNRALEAYMNTADKKKERDQQLGLLKAEKGLTQKVDENGNPTNEWMIDPAFEAKQRKQKALDEQNKAAAEGKNLTVDENGNIKFDSYSPEFIKGQQEINKAKLENDPVARALKAIQEQKAINDLEDQKRGTGDERKAAGFAKRLQQSEDIFKELSDSGYNRADDRFAEVKSSLGKLIPGVKSTELGKNEQAERNFVNAILRRESGAAISPAEFKNAESQYFPRPGDTEDVVKQKLINRKLAFDNLKSEAGRAYEYKSDGLIKPAEGLVPKGLIKPEEKKASVPKTGDVVDGYTFKGGDPSKPENWEVSKKAGL